ncbi:hypothetical protein [Alienimonas sp. DA493]|uniref:hypothetical protein n=1 Tax=Alienimonas sp. DA493 TaxID=3373605 RepID=UPI003754A785
MNQEPDTLPLGPFRFGPAEVRIAGRPTVEAFAGPLRFALWCQKGAAWWIGDLLNAGDERFGEMFSQVCEGQISASLLQRYESVARRVPRENRRPNLSWSCHAAVARLPGASQRRLLAKAEEYGWNSSVLARRARAELARLKAAGESDDDASEDDGDDEDDRGSRAEPAFREDLAEAFDASSGESSNETKSAAATTGAGE